MGSPYKDQPEKQISCFWGYLPFSEIPNCFFKERVSKSKENNEYPIKIDDVS